MCVTCVCYNVLALESLLSYKKEQMYKGKNKISIVIIWERFFF